MCIIKGYTNGSGYMGYVEEENDYREFETDDAHAEWVREHEFEKESEET